MNKNCINIPGAICNISKENGKTSGLKRVSIRDLKLTDNSATELENKCRSNCSVTPDCRGSFSMQRQRGNRILKKCYQCTTPKVPLRYKSINNLQICDDGKNPRYRYHNKTFEYEDLIARTSSYDVLNLLNTVSKDYDDRIKELNRTHLKLTNKLNTTIANLENVKKEKEIIEIEYKALQEEYAKIEEMIENIGEKNDNLIEELETNLEEVNNEMDDYKQSNDELTNLQEVLEGEYNKLEIAFKKLNTEYEKCQKKPAFGDPFMFDDEDGFDDDGGDYGDEGDEGDEGDLRDEDYVKPPPPEPPSAQKRIFELPKYMYHEYDDSPNMKCGNQTITEFYLKNKDELEKCQNNARWKCESDKDGYSEWKCPLDKYDCNWDRPDGRRRATTMEVCPTGSAKTCGKFGITGCMKEMKGAQRGGEDRERRERERREQREREREERERERGERERDRERQRKERERQREREERERGERERQKRGLRPSPRRRVGRT